MMITRLRPAGYGCFSGREFRFGPGLNVVFGENESGKSTLCRFITAMFFGHKKPGLRRSSFLDDQSLMAPWDGEAYGGILEYMLNGEVYRVERNFGREGSEIRIFEAATGREITREFPLDNRREYLFAETQLGLGRSLFEQTVYVPQLGAKADRPKELAACLVNLETTGDEGISVDKALEALQRRIDAIGTRKAPTKPYGQSVQKAEELTNRLQSLRTERDRLLEYEALDQRLCAADLSGTGLIVNEIEKLGAPVLLNQFTKAGEIALRIDELGQQMEQNQGFRDFPRQFRDELLQLSAKMDEAGVADSQTDGKEHLRDWKNGRQRPLRWVNLVLAAGAAVCALLAVAFSPLYWGGCAALTVIFVALHYLMGTHVDGHPGIDCNGINSNLTAQAEAAKRIQDILSQTGAADLEAYLSGCRRRSAWEDANTEKNQLASHLASILSGAALRLKVSIAELNRVTEDLLATGRELEAVETERDELAGEYLALELAGQVIRETSAAVQRANAPKLNQKVSEIVHNITGGRYSQVLIDRSLQIKVQDPATSCLIPLDSLSTGTIDQFWLALRMGMAGLFPVGGQSLPLIMDEPFATWDDRRTAVMAERLALLAKERQMIVFTCQQREVELFKHVGCHQFLTR